MSTTTMEVIRHRYADTGEDAGVTIDVTYPDGRTVRLTEEQTGVLILGPPEERLRVLREVF